MAAPLAPTAQQSSYRPPRQMGCSGRNDQALLAGAQRSGMACRVPDGSEAPRREAVRWERTKVERARALH
jgi:hypothetical protein